MAQAAAAAAAAACSQLPRVPTPSSSSAASTSGARAGVCFAQPFRKLGWPAGLGQGNFRRATRHRSAVKLVPECQVSDFSDLTDNARGSELDGIADALRVNCNVVPEMKSKYGAFGGATLEKSKLDLSQTTAKSNPLVRAGSLLPGWHRGACAFSSCH